jgi:hypothetical protein
MSNTEKKGISKKGILTIVASIFLFFGFVFLFGSFMNRMNMMKYKEKGISMQAKVDEVSSYKQKLTKKSSSTTKFMVKLDFSIKGAPGSAYVTEYVTEEEIDSLKEGQSVEILYLPKSEFIYEGKASFVTPPMMKLTLENSLVRNSNYLLLGGIIFGIGLITLVIRFFIKS